MLLGVLLPAIAIHAYAEIADSFFCFEDAFLMLFSLLFL